MNPAQQTLELRDIHLPANPEFWPPAPGWWILALLVVVLLALIVVRFIRWQRHRRNRQQIFSQLDELSKMNAETDVAGFLTSVSTLLRRVALINYPRSEVASLTGRQWLSFLDAHGGDGQFADGIGQVLEYGPYAPALTTENVDSAGLLALARRWIKHNSVKR